MKIIIIIFFLFALLLTVNGCDSDINSPIDESLGYFPLKAGNQWNYYHFNNDSITIQHKIVNEISLNGKKYFVREQGTYKDTLLFENNIIWTRNLGVDQKWIDFNKKNNESYQLGEYIVKVKTDLEITAEAGTFKNCIGFYFDIPNAVDDEVNYIFVKGVGIVEISGAWVYYLLKDFKVK